VKRKVLPLLAVCVLMFSLGVAIAQIIITKQLPATATLQTNHLKAYAEDGVTEITSIDFGTVEKGGNVTKIIHLENVYSTTLDASWNVENLPDGASLTVYYELRSGGDQLWGMGDWGIGMFDVGEVRKITLVLVYESGTDGNIDFTINFLTREP